MSHLLYVLIAECVTALMSYFYFKSKTVSAVSHQTLSDKYNELTTKNKIAEERVQFIRVENEELKNKLLEENRAQDAIQSELNRSFQNNAGLTASLRALEASALKQEEQIQNKTSRIEELNEKLTELVAELSKKEADNQLLVERLNLLKEEMKELQEKARIEFERIANQVLEEKTTKFTETNRLNLETLLNPLKEDIGNFRSKVETTHTEDTKQRVSLEERIKILIDQTNKVSAEANNLATALKGKPQKRGNWGELILERILEMSGLTKDREYFVQENHVNEDGERLRPDVRILLPDKRVIMIDSKVSLVAYDNYVGTENPDEQNIFLNKHLVATWQHVEQLSNKKYDNLGDTLDFTMMFVPIEPAYMLTVQSDPSIWMRAYEKRILLVSPTNLIASLKLFSDLWKRDNQSKNAMEIVKKGEELYEKFVGFTRTFEEIGKSIKQSQEKYDKAFGQLTTGKANLINKAIALKNLGLKSDKQIPESLMSYSDEPEDDFQRLN